MMFMEVAFDLMQPKLVAGIIDIGVANKNISYVLDTGGKMKLWHLPGLLVDQDILSLLPLLP